MSAPEALPESPWLSVPLRGAGMRWDECGFLTINTPGGFEEMLPDIVKWFAVHPLEDVADP